MTNEVKNTILTLIDNGQLDNAITELQKQKAMADVVDNKDRLSRLNAVKNVKRNKAKKLIEKANLLQPRINELGGVVYEADNAKLSLDRFSGEAQGLYCFTMTRFGELRFCYEIWSGERYKYLYMGKDADGLAYSGYSAHDKLAIDNYPQNNLDELINTLEFFLNGYDTFEAFVYADIDRQIAQLEQEA